MLREPDMNALDHAHHSPLSPVRGCPRCEGNILLKDHLIIDDMDMDFVQMLITAVNESKLNQPEKEQLRKKLDRWQNALMLTHTIHVTF